MTPEEIHNEANRLSTLAVLATHAGCYSLFHPLLVELARYRRLEEEAAEEAAGEDL